MEDVESKISYLLKLGFEPISTDGDCVVFRLGEIVVTASDPDQTPEQLRMEVESLMKGNDIAEKTNQDKAGEEESETEQFPDEEDPDPFVANREPVEPFYICDELKKIPTPVFVRLSLDGNRFYVRQMDDNTAKIYASITTLIQDGYVTEKTQLQEWKQELKMLGQNPEEVSQYEADKGTIMHYLYGMYLTGRDMVLSRSFLIKTIQEEKLKISKKNLDRFFASTDDLDNMLERLMRFAKFCYDYKVEPMMIERILSLEKYQVATPIDAMVRMSFKYKEEGYFGATYKRATGQFKAGDPKKEVREVEKREIVILDFKSGGIWDSYALQLEAERRMVKDWYGIDARIMNFSPKSSSNKGYTLREWTNHRELEKADCVFEQGMINHLRKEKRYRLRKGVLNIGKPYNEDDYVTTYDIAEEMGKRFKQQR